MTKTLKNLLIGVGAVFTAGAVAVGIGSKGFRNWKLKEWFNHWGKGAPAVTMPVEPDEPAKELPSVFAYLDNGEAVCDGDELPEHMTFMYSTQALSEISKTATASITLVASIEPEDAGVANVTWTARFNNNANGVSDYVTVTQNSSNRFMATVECKQPFGTPIIVECVVTDTYDDIHTASCDLDYLKIPQKISKIQLRQEKGETNYTNKEINLSSGTPVALDIYYSGSKRYDYYLSGVALAWSVGTVYEEVSTAVNDMTITIQYKSSKVTAKPWTISATQKLDFYNYLYGPSNYGSEILKDSSNKPIMTVTIALENGRTFEIYFQCNFVQGVSSVNMDTPSHTFGE